ncbi:MAG: diaminopimelate decarboxylase [Ignavibacteriae bacterium]|nr:MAG: diaminopimelate decarboxylase [Ignavibacteriota bacterium]
MKIFDSKYITYKNNELYCENIRVKEIVEKFGTPVYVYSKNYMIDKFNELSNAFKDTNHKIFFACKSNYNLSVIELFNKLGAGIDVNSAGEFYRATKAGVNPENLIMSGVGKTAEEIKLALENNIHLLKAESLGEIELINRIAKDLKKKARLAIRVNPNVDPVTHPYISTGLAENKFGIDETAVEEIFTKAAQLKNISLVGIDMHIGSQITKLEPYIEAVKKIVELVKNLENKNIKLTHIDLGGGIGIKYKDEKPFTAKEFADAVIPILRETNCKIYMEPGRFLTANGGILLTKVLYVKNNLDKNFIIVDAAMNDLLRPSIYSAYHHIQPVELNKEEKDIEADIVGPVCESGDFLAKRRKIQKMCPNELLAVMSAGAYAITMASNYNGRRMPPEVLIDEDSYKLIRKRETYEQLIQNEITLI